MADSCGHAGDAPAGNGQPQARAPLPPGFRLRLARQLATEFAPLLLFFLAFLWKDLVWATAVYALATAAAFASAWALHRRIPVLPSITTGLVLVFAGLTLVLDNELFIKIKPTVVNGFYGLVLGIGWLCGYRLVERVLGPELRLDESGLRRLTLHASLYLVGLAVLNELVWRTVPTDVWVVFKVFVLVACNLAFALSQLPLIRRHARFAAAPPGGA